MAQMKLRLDLIMNELPSICIESNFQNAYSICGIMNAGNLSKSSVVYTIEEIEENNTSDSFMALIEVAVGHGLLKPMTSLYSTMHKYTMEVHVTL